MSTKIQFKEKEMREAIAEMLNCGKKLHEMHEYFRQRASWAEKEALQGDAGEALKNAINGPLVSAITQIELGIEKEAKFAQTELDQMIKAAAKLR